ncbi:MAG TPA: HNH endonuclease, partial [Marmoricola sp.]
MGQVIVQVVGALLGTAGLLLAPLLGMAAGEQLRSAPRHPAANTASNTALHALDQLRVKGRGPMTGYDRDRFGYEWLDA